MHRRTIQISFGMKNKAPNSNQRLEDQHTCAESDELSRHSHQQWSDQKADRDRASPNRDPLQGIEESVARVIAQTENKISDKAAECKKQNPLRPLTAVAIHHAIEQQQETKSGVC